MYQQPFELGFWTAAFWYFRPCVRSPDLLERMFLTMATLFGGKLDEMVADGRPQPHEDESLPDALSVSINPREQLRVVPGWEDTSGPPLSSSAPPPLTLLAWRATGRFPRLASQH